jgi:hypothetical protein
VVDSSAVVDSRGLGRGGVVHAGGQLHQQPRAQRSDPLARGRWHGGELPKVCLARAAPPGEHGNLRDPDLDRLRRGSRMDPQWILGVHAPSRRGAQTERARPPVDSGGSWKP